jgi:hypothetical protein
MKTVGNFRRTRLRGRALTQFAAFLVGAAYNLLRTTKLLAAPAWLGHTRARRAANRALPDAARR